MNFKTATFYNIFIHFYDFVDFFFKPQKERLITEINRLQSGKLLDIGVGKGSFLTRINKHQLVGVDISEKMLQSVRKIDTLVIKLHLMDGANLNFEKEQFDYLIISHVIAVTNHPSLILKEAKRVLKPNGKLFILNHFTPNNWLQYVDKCFNPIARIFHFRSYFKISDLEIPPNIILEKKISFGWFDYYNLLIYRKL